MPTVDVAIIIGADVVNPAAVEMKVAQFSECHCECLPSQISFCFERGQGRLLRYY